MYQQEYVDLDRKYIKLIDSSSLLNIENTSEALSKRMYGKPQNIADIVRDNKIVVILGDKGSGKTTEISQFYEKHKDNSIYIELKNIYSDIKKFQSEISLLKEPSTLDCLYLLFDSIDECRMQTRGYQDAFEIVLEKIRTVLLSNPDVISKIKFIFTSRESDWRKISDDLLLRKNLTMNTLSVNPSDTHSLIGNSTEVIKNEITVSVFALKELDTSQKVLIAKSLNVNEDFFKDDVIAQEYSNTPLDCFEFIRFRLKNRNASYKLEDFLSFKLQWRYRELNEARTGNQLSIKKIEYLSKRLAVATLFCETISIKKNESYFDILKTTNDVSTFELFPEEDSSCLKNFLDSSLFLSNAEGSVKFWNELSRDHDLSPKYVPIKS